MRLICIEGNIGVGKSSLTSDLAKELGARPLFEPVAENPYLEDYYRDPKRYGLEMQYWLMSRRFEMHEWAIRHIWQTGQPVVMDRSIYGDWIFARRNHLDGNIDDKGYNAYMHHRAVMDRYLMVPHFVIFLHAKPETCLERISTRGRGCEKSVPLSYLRGLHDLHLELSLELDRKGAKILPIEWERFMTGADVAELMRNFT